ncbi:MAG: hypothetical protein OIF50_06420 [Flavobacteriaceae bacterium]|nr:hypothetical protein [Flavobacteriaceae bacterium]
MQFDNNYFVLVLKSKSDMQYTFEKRGVVPIGLYESWHMFSLEQNKIADQQLLVKGAYDVLVE